MAFAGGRTFCGRKGNIEKTLCSQSTDHRRAIKDSEFLYCSHQRKLYDPTDSTNLIHQTACELFDELWRGQPLRHLGVSVAELCSNKFLQMSLFNKHSEKQRDLDKAIDSIRRKHGSLAVHRASFIRSGLKPMTGGTGERG